MSDRYYYFINGQSSYIWDKSQVNEFESLYSVFSKFIHQNRAVTKDIWDAFGTVVNKNIKITNPPPHLNLNYGNRLSSRAMYKFLNVNEFTFYHAHIYPYLLFEKTTNYKDTASLTNRYINKNLFYDNLRFCPCCMSSHYHTPYNTEFHKRLKYYGVGPFKQWCEKAIDKVKK